MKKLLFFAMAVLLLGSTVSSCKGKTESNKLNDSIAQLMGKLEGTKIKEKFQEDSVFSKQYDKDKYLKGMMAIINMDSTNKYKSYIDGMKAGLELYEEFLRLDSLGISIDRSIYLKEFQKIIYDTDPIDMEKVGKEKKDMEDQIECLQNKTKQKCKWRLPEKGAAHSLLKEKVPTSVKIWHYACRHYL